jgi:hypothetical protein
MDHSTAGVSLLVGEWLVGGLTMYGAEYTIFYLGFLCKQTSQRTRPLSS